MDIDRIVALGFALWFVYQALQHLMAWSSAGPERPFVPFALFVYCLLAGLLLLYFGGFFAGHLAR